MIQVLFTENSIPREKPCLAHFHRVFRFAKGNVHTLYCIVGIPAKKRFRDHCIGPKYDL